LGKDSSPKRVRLYRTDLSSERGKEKGASRRRGCGWTALTSLRGERMERKRDKGEQIYVHSLRLFNAFIRASLGQSLGLVIDLSVLSLRDLGTEREPIYALKKGLQKRTLAQNCFNLTIQNEITTKLFLYQKTKNLPFPRKVVISKNCASCKNGYLNFFL